MLIDLLIYYSAGEILRLGGNVYDVGLLREVMIGNGYAEALEVIAFPAPPMMLYLFSFLSLFPFPVAACAWSLLNVAIVQKTIANISCVSSLSSFSTLHLGQRMVLLLSFWPVWKALYFGQTSLIVMSCVVYSNFLLSRGRNFAAGLVLSGMWFKPQFMAPIFGILLVAAFQRRLWTLFTGFSVASAVHALLTLSIQPEVYTRFLSQNHTIAQHLDMSSASLVDFIALTVGIDLPLWLPIVLGVSGGVLIAARLGMERDLLVRAVLPLCLLSAPYGWSHDYVLILYHYLFLGTKAFARRGERSVLGLIMIQVFVNAVLLATAEEAYTFWFPILISLGTFIEGRNKPNIRTTTASPTKTSR